jgi:DNA-binding NtrC family response regulator
LFTLIVNNRWPRPDKSRLSMPPFPETQPPPARLLLIDADRARASVFAPEFIRCLKIGAEVTHAPSGRSGLEQLRQARFDVVFADLASLDDLAPTGDEAVARLVKFTDGALMVAQTEDPAISVAISLLGAGAHDVVVPPVAMPELVRRFAQLAQRHGRAALFPSPHPAAAANDGERLSEASARMREIAELLGWSGDSAQLREALRRLAGIFDDAAPAAPSRPQRVLPMWQQEQRIIEEAIASFSGNIALAAAALELSPSTIYRKRQAWAEMAARKGAA